MAKYGLSNRLAGILAIAAGILILVFPGLLQWIVAIFLIVWGVLTLMGKN